MSRPESSAPEQRVESILDDWPAEPTSVAEKILDKYGPPDAASSQQLLWHETGPWKRTVLYRDGVPHEFPDTHVDYLEQVIDYRVPPEYYDDLGRFDGSVTVRRTRGELSAECHGEPANFLALNLAHDIVTDEKSVEEARRHYTEIYARKEAGGEPEYIQAFQFELPTGEQRDPDEQTLTEEIEAEAKRRVDE